MPTRKRSSRPDVDAADAAEPDNLTPPRTRARSPRGGPLTDEERAQAQETFLLVYARTANVSQSAKRARISRETFYQWRDHDEAFRARLTHADEDAQDVLRGETFRRAVVGVNEPLTNGAGLIYETEEVVGEDGAPVLDSRGRPKMRRVKIATVKKYSDGLLQAMLKARVPEYREKKQVELSGPDGGPMQTRHTIDYAAIQTLLVAALAQFPEAQHAVAAALLRLDQPDEHHHDNAQPA